MHALIGLKFDTRVEQPKAKISTKCDDNSTKILMIIPINKDRSVDQPTG